MKLDKEKIGEKIGNFANDAKKITENISGKTKEVVTKSKNKIVETMDASLASFQTQIGRRIDNKRGKNCHLTVSTPSNIS